MEAVERKDYNAEQLTNELTHISTRDGLLWREEKIIMLPEADRIARRHGYGTAEGMVKALEFKQKEALNESRKSD